MSQEHAMKGLFLPLPKGHYINIGYEYFISNHFSCQISFANYQFNLATDAKGDIRSCIIPVGGYYFDNRKDTTSRWFLHAGVLCALLRESTYGESDSGNDYPTIIGIGPGIQLGIVWKFSKHGFLEIDPYLAYEWKRKKTKGPDNSPNYSYYSEYRPGLHFVLGYQF